jgi:hypothetical protein
MSMQLTLIPVLVGPSKVFGVPLDDQVGEVKSYIREQCGTVGCAFRSISLFAIFTGTHPELGQPSLFSCTMATRN